MSELNRTDNEQAENLGTSPNTAPDLEQATAEEVLAYATERFNPRLYIACSFQKEESVIVDMVSRIAPETKLFVLDTDVLFPETYELWNSFSERYGLQIDTYKGIPLQEQAERYGDKLWEREPNRCCEIRKVKPLKQALSHVDAWVTGLRREQSPLRASAPKFGWDSQHGIWKINPLADWTEKQLWNYILDRKIPYNPLHDRGYASIGCTHCTLPGAGREGRWSGNSKTECGLHLSDTPEQQDN